MLYIEKLSEILRRKQSFNLKKSGFTLAELLVALVAIAVVVGITLPITLNKMGKATYASYWMGYQALKDMSANILQTVLNTPLEEPESPCIVENFGQCITEPAFIPTPVSKSECEEMLAEYGDILNDCYYEQDYYAGAVKACDGHIPDAYGIMPVFDLVHYATEEDREALEKLNLINPGKYVATCMSGTTHEEFDCVQDYTAFWFDRETGKDYAAIYTSSTGSGGDSHSDRNNSTAYAVCYTPMEEEPPSDEELLDTYNEILCHNIKEDYNIKQDDCSVTPETVQNKVSVEKFEDLTPNIVMASGLKVYIGSDLGVIPDLSDAVDENDREGFIIYVDVNGNSGKSELWKDVFPFYLLKSGKVIPAYKDDEPSGGTSKEHLSANVMYDVFEGGKREVRLLLKDANFRRAACTTGYIKSATYCGEFVQYDICKDLSHDCRLQIKEPIKLF